MRPETTNRAIMGSAHITPINRLRLLIQQPKFRPDTQENRYKKPWQPQPACQSTVLIRQLY